MFNKTLHSSKEVTHKLSWIDTENKSKEVHKSFSCSKQAMEFSLGHLKRLEKEGFVKSIKVEGL